MDEKEYKRLHAKVEEEAIRNHEAVDRIWAFANQGIPPPIGAWHRNGTSTPLPTTETNRAKPSAKPSTPQDVFPLTEEVRKVIDTFEGDFSQPMIVERLRANHPHLESKIISGQLGVQISGILNRFLHKQGVIEIVKKGYSNFPNIYKKTAKWKKTV